MGSLRCFFFFRINDLEYGRGTGSSKKVAKAEAAKKTLEMLIPEIRDKLPSLSAGDMEGDAPDLSFFDGILVEDSRVADLCNRCDQSEAFIMCLNQSETFILYRIAGPVSRLPIRSWSRVSRGTMASGTRTSTRT